MRIVLDPNVVLRRCCGAARPISCSLRSAQQASIQLYCNIALLDELANVLVRPSARKRLAIIGKTAREVLADCVEVVEPSTVPRVVPTDPDDDLLTIVSVESISVVTATQAVKRIGR